jgi:hypothetical protein
MWTFKESSDALPVAVIKGGKYNGKMLCLKQIQHSVVTQPPKALGKKQVYSESDEESDEDDDTGRDDNILDYLDDKIFKNYKLSPKDSEAIRRALRDNKSKDLDKSLSVVFSKAKKDIDEKLDKEIKIEDGEVIPIPEDTDNGRHLYIAGPTGSGKSTWVANWVKMYRKLFPSNRVYLFSRKEEDKVLSQMKYIKKIVTNEKLLEKKLDALKDFSGNCLVIFDDTKEIQPKEVQVEVNRIRDDLLSNGRDRGISVVCTAHLIADHKESKFPLNESTNVVLFPHSGGSQSKYFLSKYIGLNTKEIARLLKVNSRWLMVKKHSYPQFYLHQHGAIIL